MAKVEEGALNSIRSVTFIVPLELDCDEADAVPEAEEGNQNAESEGIYESMQSSVNIDEENGIENKSADLLLATEPSTSLNNEGDFFHHNDTPPESSPHPTRLELTTVEEAPSGPSEPENLIDQPAIRPQKRAARRQ